MVSFPSAVQLTVLFAYVVNLVGTYLSNTGAYGSTNANVSNHFHTLITPPGYAFSIWAIIFVWQGIACVAQCLPRFRQQPIFPPIAIAGWTLTCVAQVAWSVAFAQESIKLSMAFIALIWTGLLLTTIGMKQSASGDQRLVTAAPGPISRVVTWTVLKAPFSLHFGWLSAAMCVNGEVVAVSQCETIAHQVTLAVLTLAFLTTMVTQISVVHADCAYAAAVCWALFSLRDRDATGAVCTPDGLVPPSPAIGSALTDAAVGLASALISASAIRTSIDLFVPKTLRDKAAASLNCESQRSDDAEKSNSYTVV